MTSDKGVNQASRGLEAKEVEDIFQVLERLASGDPSARLTPKGDNELLDRLRSSINKTAENLAEIVDMTHEFAMGLAEHFDVLQRVSGGDLDARIVGDSKHEILGLLKALTNGTIGQLADEIQSRRKAQEDLVRLATAIEQIADGIIITDSEGVCLYANPAFSAMSGYSNAEIKDKKLKDLESIGANLPSSSRMVETLRFGQTWRGRLTNHKKDNSVYVEECTISPVRNFDGETTNFVIIKRDITKEIELKKKLEQSQKMEALGTLAGGIAHELNNLLTPIVGFSELLLEEVEGKERAEKDVRQIIQAAERSRQIITQILAFSRIEEITSAKMTSVTATVKDSIEMLKEVVPSYVDLAYHDDCPEEIVVSIGGDQIQHILVNLVLNAATAMHNKSGKISITVKEASPEAVSKLSGEAEGLFVELAVEDNGSGISEEDRQKIFEPFYSTKPVGEGTGMGLAVVHGLVSGVGGFITLESELGKGTSFHLFFPAANDQNWQDGEIVPEPEEDAKKKPLILLVDDEDLVIDALERQLVNFGYDVDAYLEPDKALSAFIKRQSSYDLVITDYAMPTMSGLVLAAEIRSIRQDIPILICSGFPGNISDSLKSDLGIVNILNKPTRKGELARAVEEALSGDGEI